MDRDRGLDLLLAAAIVATEVANLLLVSDGAGHRDPATVALLAGSALPLVWWRRAPFVVLLACATSTIVLAALGDPHLGLGCDRGLVRGRPLGRDARSAGSPSPR